MNSLTRNHQVVILVILWGLVQCFLMWQQGIFTTLEAGRVIREANNLAESGNFSNPIYFTYLTEIILVYLVHFLGLGYGIIIAIHLALNLLALLIFYNFSEIFFSSKNIAFVSGILLTICIPYQSYNYYLYTESLFFSFTIIYSCYLLSVKKFNAGKLIKLVALLLLVCITRPTGIFFLFATITYLFFFLKTKYPLTIRLYTLAVLSVFVLFIVNYVMGTGGGIDIILPLREGHVICDLPTFQNKNIKTDPEDNSIAGLINYIYANFPHFLNMAYLKTKAFFGLTRPFYSTMHNLFMSFFFYPLYLLIVGAIIKFRKSLPLAFIYIYSLVIFFWLIVVFSCDEWHNRFFLTLVPFLLTSALYYFKKKNKP